MNSRSEKRLGAGFMSRSIVWIHSRRWVVIWISSTSGFQSVRTTITGIWDAEDINRGSKRWLGIGVVSRSVIGVDRRRVLNIRYILNSEWFWFNVQGSFNNCNINEILNIDFIQEVDWIFNRGYYNIIVIVDWISKVDPIFITFIIYTLVVRRQELIQHIIFIEYIEQLKRKREKGRKEG